VLVTDQYGNPVSGVDVDFDDGGAGGTYSYVNPGVTSNSGTLTQFYTLPPSPGTITITATATGVATLAVFTKTAQ
jgi:protocatechuate 3,4-dioxygenase beta subunit